MDQGLKNTVLVRLVFQSFNLNDCIFSLLYFNGRKLTRYVRNVGSIPNESFGMSDNLTLVKQLPFCPYSVNG